MEEEEEEEEEEQTRVGGIHGGIHFCSFSAVLSDGEIIDLKV